MAKNEIKSATDFIRNFVQNPGAYPDTFISLPMDPELIATVLSRERTRLIQYLQQHGPLASVHRLAEALHRNYASVSRDLGVLIDLGLISAERRGKTKEISATGRPIIIMGASARNPLRRTA